MTPNAHNGSEDTNGDGDSMSGNISMAAIPTT